MPEGPRLSRPGSTEEKVSASIQSGSRVSFSQPVLRRCAPSGCGLTVSTRYGSQSHRVSAPCRRSAGGSASLHDSTFSRTVSWLYGGAKGPVVRYYTWRVAGGRVGLRRPPPPRLVRRVQLRLHLCSST
jgi:hypothetical protein